MLEHLLSSRLRRRGFSTPDWHFNTLGFAVAGTFSFFFAGITSYTLNEVMCFSTLSES
jgi:hypothetical protein